MFSEIPINEYYEYFGPDYELDVKASNMDDLNSPEYLDANLEDLWHRADSIPTQTKAEILVYGLHKSGSFVT